MTTILCSENPIGKSNNSSSALASDYKHLGNRKQTREILRDKIECRNHNKCIDGSAWNQDQWRESMSTFTSFLVEKKEGPATKDGNLSVTDEYVNSTPSGSAHFLRLRSPTNASVHSLIFLRVSNHQGSTTIQRYVFASCWMSCVVRATCVHRLHTDATLDTNDTQANILDCNTRQGTPAQEECLAFLVHEPLLHDQHDKKRETVHETYLPDPAV